jgi:hypothetical protein
MKSPKGFLDGWNHFLQRWLSCYLLRANVPETMPDRGQARMLLECSRLLTLIGNQGLCSRLNAVVPIYRNLQIAKDNALGSHQTALREFRRQVQDYWFKLYKTKTVPDAAQYCAELAATPWWKKLWYRSAYKGLLTRQREYSDLELPLSAQVVEEELGAVTKAIVCWLGASIHAHMPIIERTPGHIGLALLLCDDDEGTQREMVSRWFEAQPWESETRCADALSKLGTTERVQRAITWLYQFGGDQSRATLRASWLAVMDQARPLAAILAALASDRPDFKKALQSEDAGIPQNLQVDAIAAILAGRDEALLHDSLYAWFEDERHGGPLRDTTLKMSVALLRARKWYDLALSINPEPHYQGEMGDKLLQFVELALRSASAGQSSSELTGADGDLIWDALESSRLSLLGLKSSVPDHNWERDTVTALIAALEDGLTRAPIGTYQTPFDHFFDWPALAEWKKRARALLYQGSSEENILSAGACGKALQQGESFVQVYFDPHEKDSLRAVWLSKDKDGKLHELKVRSFGNATAYENWCDDAVTPTKPLEVWTLFLDKSEQVAEFSSRNVWQVLKECAPIKDLASSLINWATEDDVNRLIVIWPAVLAQLPLEALLAELWEQQDLAPIILEREVSVNHFVQQRALRVPSEIVINSTRSASLDCSDRNILPHVLNLVPQIGIAFDCIPKLDDAISCLDVLDDLHRSSESFLMFHGHYHGIDPRLSELLLGKQARMPVWALAALDTSAEFVALSACESGMTGRSINKVLGPIGIAPAICASGARGVVASLWKCNAEAAVVFWHHLLTQAKFTSYPLDWTKRVREAQKHLQTITCEQADDLFARLFDDMDRFGHWPEDVKVVLTNSRLSRQARVKKGGQPYKSPYYWAPFIYLGSQQQMLLRESH